MISRLTPAARLSLTSDPRPLNFIIFDLTRIRQSARTPASLHSPSLQSSQKHLESKSARSRCGLGWDGDDVSNHAAAGTVCLCAGRVDGLHCIWWKAKPSTNLPMRSPRKTTTNSARPRSHKFEERALRTAEALDDFKILNLPKGETTRGRGAGDVRDGKTRHRLGRQAQKEAVLSGS